MVLPLALRLCFTAIDTLSIASLSRIFLGQKKTSGKAGLTISSRAQGGKAQGLDAQIQLNTMAPSCVKIGWQLLAKGETICKCENRRSRLSDEFAPQAGFLVARDTTNVSRLRFERVAGF